MIPVDFGLAKSGVGALRKNVQSQWKEETLRMKPGHTWKSQPGYKIFVADRGAVRFQIPKHWIVEPDARSVKFFDGAPPNDNCRLECSYLRIPSLDWSGLPLSELIAVALKGDPRETVMSGDIVQPDRQDLEIAWAEFSFVDSNEQRSACTRVCIARGSGIQCLLTLDFWPEDAARINPVWLQVIRTVELGRYVTDPTKGETIH